MFLVIIIFQSNMDLGSPFELRVFLADSRRRLVSVYEVRERPVFTFIRW